MTAARSRAGAVGFVAAGASPAFTLAATMIAASPSIHGSGPRMAPPLRVVWFREKKQTAFPVGPSVKDGRTSGAKPVPPRRPGALTGRGRMRLGGAKKSREEDEAV